MLRPLAASFDHSFLETVKDSFYTSLDRFLLVIPFLMGVLTVVVALAVLVTLVNLILRRIRGKRPPVGVIANVEEIRELIDTAIRDRSRLDLKFLPADSLRKSMACTLVDLIGDTLVVEPPTYVVIKPEWMGRRVECFFRLNTTKGQTLFYTFETTVLGVSSMGNAIMRLDLVAPSTLRLEQKRSFLRIDPPQHYFLGLALWLDSWDSGMSPPSNVKSWGRPPLVFTPDKTQNPVLVSNISGSGLRLSIRHDAVRAMQLSPNIGGRVLILLDLYDPDTERKKRFWLRCRIQNLHEDFNTRDLEIGLQCIGSGRPVREEDPYELEWQTVGDSGVEPLAKWVMRRHLELYRDKGLEL
ncbi:PilZ domain-containing protein [Megalodesulfovibrio paquesii]